MIALGCLVIVVLVAAWSPYIMRHIAAACLAQAFAVEAYRAALRAHHREQMVALGLAEVER
jgi:hypothetical protein